jgi:vancomycin resistance protein VanJ
VSVSAQLDDAPARTASGVRRWLRRLLVACALAYPVTLLALTLGFYCIGEGWWVTAVGLYVPRLPLAVPLPFAVAILWATGLRRWLWAELAAGFVLIVPFMGFVPPSLAVGRGGGPALRVLSFNVNSAYGGPQAVADEIFAEAPDLVLLQESPWGPELADILRRRYPFVETSTQFIIASRYKITSHTDPDRLPFFGRLRSPRFMRYQLDTPLGQIAVYSVHPISPRGVLHLRQFRAALHELRTGELFAHDPEAEVRSNFGLRALQIETAAEAAAKESGPVLIAGDTNLPGLSAVFRRNLSGYADAFRSTSWGFGYTFPEKYPFLRLDRILANDKLRFVSFHVDCHGVSDHLCVVADLEARQ